MSQGTSRCAASRQILFLVHTGKASLAILVKMASQQQDMLLALALQTQVIFLVLLQKQMKKRSFGFMNFGKNEIFKVIMTI